MATVPTVRLQKSIQISIEGRQCPYIRITCDVINELTEDLVRRAVAEFFDEGKDVRGKDRRITSVHLEPDTTTLSMAYQTAAVSGVDNVLSEWPPDIKDELEQLAKYRLDGQATIELAPDAEESATQLKNAFAGPGRASTGELWNCFGIGGVDAARTQWSDMVDAYLSKSFNIRPGIVTTAASHHFSSLEEARIKLSYATFAEHQWECMVAEDLCEGEFTGAFIQVAPRVILACIRRKYDGKKLEKAALDEHMDVTLSYQEDDNDADSECEEANDIVTTGRLTSNHVNVECDFVIMLQQKKIPRDVLYKAGLAARYGPTFIKMTVKIDVIEKLAKDCVEGVNHFFDRQVPMYASFWPAFLAEGSQPIEQQNFMYQKMNLTKAAFDIILEKVVGRMTAEGRPPNEEQEKILKECCYTHGGLSEIWGPPGTGKTYIAAALAQIYLTCPSTGVAMFGPSNASADRLMEGVTGRPWSTTPDERYKPLRPYRTFLEMQHFWKAVDPRGRGRTYEAKSKINETAIGRYYARQQQAADAKVMKDPDLGVASAVLRAVDANNLLRAPSPRSQIQEAHYQAALHAARILKTFLKRARAPTGGKLSGFEQEAAEEAFDKVRKQVVGAKRLIISTLGNSSSRLLQDVAMRDVKHVVLELDEQAFDKDTSLINTLVNFVKKDRIEEEFDGVTPVRKIDSFGDPRQNAPLVKSYEANANVFGPQLATSTFVRRMKTGAKVQELLETHRLPEILCELPNRRGYDMKLRTSTGAKANRLTERQKNFIAEYFDLDLSSLQPQLGKPQAEFEDQYVRHLLLNVPKGRAQVETSTQSRFNTANIEITMAFVKHMITSGLFRPHEIRVLTFYNAQRRRHINAIFDLADACGLTGGELDDMVHTSDSFQGCEAKYVVLDLVTTHYNGPESMGHAGNELKANTAYTRASECLWVVGSLGILGGRGVVERQGRGTRREEFVMDSLRGLRERGAWKSFEAGVAPEGVQGVVFEDDEVAEREGLLAKGSAVARMAPAATNGDALVDGVSELRLETEGGTGEQGQW